MKMRKSYIANSAEALNIHNGTQTAIVVAMKLPKWCKRIELQGDNPNDPKCYYLVDFDGNNATGSNGEYLTLMDIAPYPIGQEVYVRERWMNVYDSINKKTTPTRFKIVGCEAIRVQGLTVGNGLELGCSSGNWGSARKLIISKFGQSAWDNNDYIWFYKI
jgi:hypothetical protein